MYDAEFSWGGPGSAKLYLRTKDRRVSFEDPELQTLQGAFSPKQGKKEKGPGAMLKFPLKQTLRVQANFPIRRNDQALSLSPLDWLVSDWGG